jgi:hypothetical protein
VRVSDAKTIPCSNKTPTQYVMMMMKIQKFAKN